MLALLGACHLFSALEIPCAAGERCVRERDSGTETDTGSTVVEDPTVGWVVSYSTGEGGAARRFKPGGEQVNRWDDLPGAGPIAWSDDLGSVVVDGVLFELATAGYSDTVSEVPAGGVFDIDRNEDTVYVAVGTNVLRYDGGDADWQGIFPEDRNSVGHLARTGEDLFVTDEDGQGATLFYYEQDDGTTDTEASGFSGSRGRNVFLGPDDEAYACSTAGAIYRVEDLAAGGTAHVAWYEDGTDDVTDCAWDPASRDWLVFSPSAGVIRLTSSGAARTLSPPPEGYTAVRANFFFY